MKKILVIDGNSIINRAFYGVRPLTTKAGKHTNAIFGMINIIQKQLDTIKPDYAAVAFDVKAPTFRHAMYSEYKAGRNPTPTELLEQFPDAKLCLELLGFNVLELPGYEADDIQGTIADFAHKEAGVESYILTGDRDLLQLIDDKVTVLLAGNSDTKVMRREQFVEKYGITPDLFVDMKALMGDSSDNIPGVRGIGEKTAASLIQNFGKLEDIYDNLEDSRITKSVRAKLEADRDNAFLSRTLAKIKTDTPIEKTLDELKYRDIDRGGLYKKFTELELNSFITKYGLSQKDCVGKPESEICDKAQAPIAPSAPSAPVTEGTPEVTKELADKTVAIMLEEERVLLSDGEGNYAFPCDISALSELFSKKHDVICYDGKALIHKVREAGIKINEDLKFLDLMLYAYVINPGGAISSPESLVSMFLNADITEGLTPNLMFELERALREKIEKEGMTFVLDEIELPLLPILAQMEEYGFKIDSDGMKEFSRALEDLENELKERIYVQALGEFNINSPKQLGEVLFVKLGLPYKAKKNKNGFSTDAETLESLRPYSPIIDDILEYRQVAKLRGTYAQALPKVADGGSRIHTDFKQALTATGRLSSADPNLQNIPIRTKMGRQMRKYFIADEGYTLVDADYSQIELRLLAHISGDYNMSESFKSGADIHRKTASAVFGVPEEAVNEEMRKRAKAVNFGIIYGISGFSLAKDIGTTTKEASKYIKNYLMNYPDVEIYLEKVVEDAKENGYTTTEFGRRRYIPELNAANGMLRAFGKRVAMNAPIQGTAADIMKLAMIKVFRRLRADVPTAKLVMQVHDELIVECRDSDAQAVMSILKEEMEGAADFTVPLTAEVTCGKNWLEQN